jgi:hypothetical protein
LAASRRREAIPAAALWRRVGAGRVLTESSSRGAKRRGDPAAAAAALRSPGSLRSRRRRRFRLNPPRSSFVATHDGVGSISGRNVLALRIWRVAPAREMTGIEPCRTLGLPVAIGRQRTGGSRLRLTRKRTPASPGALAAPDPTRRQIADWVVSEPDVPRRLVAAPSQPIQLCFSC